MLAKVGSEILHLEYWLNSIFFCPVSVYYGLSPLLCALVLLFPETKSWLFLVPCVVSGAWTIVRRGGVRRASEHLSACGRKRLQGGVGWLWRYSRCKRRDVRSQGHGRPLSFMPQITTVATLVTAQSCETTYSYSLVLDFQRRGVWRICNPAGRSRQ